MSDFSPNLPKVPSKSYTLRRHKLHFATFENILGKKKQN